MRANTSVGHYQILKQLGQGGMGVVYLAHDDKLGRQIALKLLAPHLAQDQGIVKRFLAEARAVANLEHNHIVRLYDAGEAEGQLYFTMEYVAGKDLCDILAEKGPLPLSRVTDIAAQVAAALDFAHQRGIVHRDIKSANILMTSDGVAKVADFGIARVAGNTGMTGAGAIIGTADYIAPEIWNGQAAGPASDQYALGILVYELLRGNVPFQGDTPITKGFAHVNHAVPKVSLPDTQANARVTKALERALAKRPEDRFPTCCAFVEALQESKAPPKPQSRVLIGVAFVCVVVASVLLLMALNRTPESSSSGRSSPPIQANPLAKAQEIAGKGTAAVEALNSLLPTDLESNDFLAKFAKPLSDLQESGKALLGTTAPISHAKDARQLVAKGHYFLGVREFNLYCHSLMHAQLLKDPQIHVSGSAIRKQLEEHASRASSEFTQYLTTAREQGISAAVSSEMQFYLKAFKGPHFDTNPMVREFKVELDAADPARKNQ